MKSTVVIEANLLSAQTRPFKRQVSPPHDTRGAGTLSLHSAKREQPSTSPTISKQNPFSKWLARLEISEKLGGIDRSKGRREGGGEGIIVGN